MNRFRNIVSLLAYGVRLGVVNMLFFVINAILLIYAISDFDKIVANNLVVLICLIFANIVWQVVSLLYDIVILFYPTGHYLDKNIVEYNLSAEVESKYRILDDSKYNIHIIYSPTANNLMISGKPISIIKTNYHRKKVFNYIFQNQGLLLLFLKAKWHSMGSGAFFNESKLCQASEFDNYNDNISVRVCKGCYYNSFVTNDIYLLKLRHQDGMTLYPPLSSRIVAIEEYENSMFSNHIGISLLAITTDGYMIILQHNNKSAISTNMYAPSASGSVDYIDWKQGSDVDFREVLIRAAHRELCEETGFKKDLIIDTKIIGAYRNVARGGKPEYCGIANINIRKIDAKELFKAESKEVLNKVEPIKVFDSSGNFDFTNFKQFAESHQSLISVALYMNVIFLRNYVTNDGINCL